MAWVRHPRGALTTSIITNGIYSASINRGPVFFAHSNYQVRRIRWGDYMLEFGPDADGVIWDDLLAVKWGPVTITAPGFLVELPSMKSFNPKTRKVGDVTK